jgi:hypothetical protein
MAKGSSEYAARLDGRRSPVNTGAPLPGVDQAQERVLHYQRKLHEWANHPMCSWRAGCGESRTSGSEGGGEETTG